MLSMHLLKHVKDTGFKIKDCQPFLTLGTQTRRSLDRFQGLRELVWEKKYNYIFSKN